MNKQNHIKTHSRFLLLFLIIVGLGLVGFALYVINGIDGNKSIKNSGQINSQNTLDTIKSRAIQLEKSAVGEIAAMSFPDEIKKIPPHQFIGPSGSIKTIEQFSGKVLLVNLWASWCGPCREEMPALSQLHAAKSGEDFSVITINIDRGERDKPQGFLNEMGVDNLTLYQDASMAIFNALKKEGIAFGLPVTMLLDENGFILASMNGPADWSSPDALSYINAAIATTGAGLPIKDR